MRIVPETLSDQELLPLARKIGETAGIPNHVERARQCYKIIIDSADYDLIREAKKHSVELEQCSLFVNSVPLAKAMTDAAEFLRRIVKEL
jgi:hypothetical protein